MKKTIMIWVLPLLCCSLASAQRTDQPWQLDLSTGIQSIYAPVKNLHWSRPEWVGMAGLGKLIGSRQQFTVKLQLGFARNNYQGDAIFLQLMGEYTPVIAEKIELGLGLGAGYRLALYPAKPLKWNGHEWREGRPFKGLFQVPVQLSVGYRSLHLNPLEFRPYIAYQLQPQFGYNPDLSILPVSNLLIGVKIHNYKK